MSWTRNGTVSVTNNSKKVYGAGTPWGSNGKTRPGDEFVAPNGARHEVESVQSNTELSLVMPYMGATASGQSYALLHIGMLTAELAVGVSALQSKYLVTVEQFYEWQTSTAESVPLTNPATGVTANVTPLGYLLANLPGDFIAARNAAEASKVSAAAAASDAEAAWSAALAANPDINPVVRMNPSRVTVNLTIPSGYNAASAGPLEIAEGVSVTLNDNSHWSIV